MRLTEKLMNTIRHVIFPDKLYTYLIFYVFLNSNSAKSSQKHYNQILINKFSCVQSTVHNVRKKISCLNSQVTKPIFSWVVHLFLSLFWNSTLFDSSVISFITSGEGIVVVYKKSVTLNVCDTNK